MKNFAAVAIRKVRHKTLEFGLQVRKNALEQRCSPEYGCPITPCGTLPRVASAAYTRVNSSFGI
jgi:hypothetical protein